MRMCLFFRLQSYGVFLGLAIHKFYEIDDGPKAVITHF